MTGAAGGTALPPRGSPESAWQQLRAIEGHREACEQCRVALDDLPGKHLLCERGDRLVVDFYRGYYQRHMEQAQARKALYRGRDPFGEDGSTSSGGRRR